MFNSDFSFKGKHATYVKFLNKKTSQNSDTKSAELFSSAVNIYEIAPLIGLAYNRKADLDRQSTDNTNILASAMVKHQNNLDFAFRLVMLADESCGLTSDEKIDRAFKQDEDEEKTKANLDLFNAYARGGIEWLYENLISDGTVKQDFIDNILITTETFAKDFSIIDDKN